MATHKFRVGQKVQFIAGRFERYFPADDYEIVRQLPESEGEFNYWEMMWILLGGATCPYNHIRTY